MDCKWRRINYSILLKLITILRNYQNYYSHFSPFFNKSFNLFFFKFQAKRILYCWFKLKISPTFEKPFTNHSNVISFWCVASGWLYQRKHFKCSAFLHWNYCKLIKPICLFLVGFVRCKQLRNQLNGNYPICFSSLPNWHIIQIGPVSFHSLLSVRTLIVH